MNATLPQSQFRDFHLPASTISKSSKPTPRMVPMDDDAQQIHVLYPSEDVPSSSGPHFETDLGVLNVEDVVLPGSVMRRIENELLHDRCDARTVFNSCRGLARGSREFEDAYIASRIRAFLNQPRVDPRTQKNALMGGSPQHAFQSPSAQDFPHPMAVMHLGHLMSHMGIWVIGLLGIQFFAAWRLGALLTLQIDGNRLMYFGIGLILFLALDTLAWLRCRRRLIDAFLMPGGVLLAVSVLPIVAFYISPLIRN